MDTINFKKYVFLLMFVSLLFAGCEKLFEPYDRRTYYDVTGVGYVYNKHSKEPVGNAVISVGSGFEDKGFGTVQPEHEHFETDVQGYYHIKFLKRYRKSNVQGYSVCVSVEDNNLKTSCISFSIDYLKIHSISNTLKLDTLWLQ